jgi:Holliday junction resolvase RusA-like endonuclease
LTLLPFYGLIKEMYHVVIKVNSLPQNTNSNAFRSHWSKYAETKRWEKLIGAAVNGNLPRNPVGKARILYIRRSCGTLDWDNLVGCFKPIQDALVRCQILSNDSIKEIPEIPVYKQEKVKRGEGSISIEIWEIS